MPKAVFGKKLSGVTDKTMLVRRWMSGLFSPHHMSPKQISYIKKIALQDLDWNNYNKNIL